MTSTIELEIQRGKKSNISKIIPLQSYCPDSQTHTQQLVSWSLTSLFSTNMAISETSTHTADQLLYIKVKVKKVKASHTWYQALGPQLIAAYRQSAHRQSSSGR